ncbi:MAG: phosphopentomutase [Firmicutes bacterium]|nr:phosphopentomutase [Bacillota bacterium]
MDIPRVILLVLDSVGVGELPDAAEYGDAGSATLPNVAKAVGGLDLPNLESLGLGNIVPIEGVPPQEQCQAGWGKMAEKSPGKDTTTGHWEMMGVILPRPFPVYPYGFPVDVIEAFEQRIGRKVLGNKVASGTEIIKELGQTHLETGYPIVYTSADSVFQIAAHEQIISVDKLYEMCKMARELLQGEHGVGRVIARPFLGSPGEFWRTEGRRDFSLPPLQPTLLDRLQEAGYCVYGIGKIPDIFAGQGITRVLPAHGNQEVFETVLQAMQELKEPGLVFANLVDFDMLWGHRNDSQGYAQGLEAFDVQLPVLLNEMTPQDLLVITADHGCDPTTLGTDHTREYVPLIVVGRGISGCKFLGVRETFADLAASIAEFFNLNWQGVGTSIWSRVDARQG